MRWGVVGRCGDPITKPSHDFLQILAPGGAKRYKTGKEKPLEIISVPIVVVVVVNAVISDRLGGKW